MMSVLEYANDVNHSVEDILKLCKQNNIKVLDGNDMLDDESITVLDNTLDTLKNYELDEEMDDVVEDLIETNNIKLDDSIKKQKLKKKSLLVSSNDKKEFLKEKKALYKNKEKLMSNSQDQDEDVVLYKENMTVASLAEALNVSSAELVKKLFNLGLMITLNSSLDFDTASLLVSDYKKELKK